MLRVVLGLILLGFASTFAYSANIQRSEIVTPPGGGQRIEKIPAPQEQVAVGLLLAASYVAMALALFLFIADWRLQWSLAGISFVCLIIASYFANTPGVPGAMLMNIGTILVFAVLLLAVGPFQDAWNSNPEPQARGE